MKVVVVVGQAPEDKIFFEGEKLKVINPSSVGSLQVPILVVMDGEEELGVFRKWRYWKKVE